MMFTISSLLALVALITIPLSLLRCKRHRQRARKTRFVAQWRHTGVLNAQVEEAFTGHSLVKVFGRQQRGRGSASARRTRSSTTPASAPSSSPGSSSPR